MDWRAVRTVAIVGAGVAGLASARALMAKGLDCTLFERASQLGGVWRDGYSNFGLQVQRELYEFPDWPLPPDTPDFTPGPIVQRYLTDFAERFAIAPHIRFETEVIEIAEGAGPDSGWTIAWRHGESEGREAFDLVIVCIGLYSNRPHMPDFPGAASFTGLIMHNSRFKSRDQLAGKRVAILGYGKGATDAALEAANVAEETHIIFRGPHWPLPPYLAGILPFKWGMLNRLTSALIPPYQNATPVERRLHGIGRPLSWFYWRLVETLLYFQCKLGSRFGSRLSLVPDKPIEIDAFGESTMLPRKDFFPLLRQGAIKAHRTTIEAYGPSGVKLANGSEIDIDILLLATGWRADFSFLAEGVRKKLAIEEDGFYLYRHMLCPALPGLVFIGRASTVSSILTYSLQARWLAELLRGRFELPAADEMARNIEEMKAWKRAWIPFSPARSARLIAHMQHYHDELLRDFHASPWRKTGVFAPLKELIFPYEPSDYASIVSGAWRKEEKEE